MNISAGLRKRNVRNIITSMRLISDVDWPELFERISLVDDVLRPAAISRHGFSDAQSLSHRHRGTGARRRTARNSTLRGSRSSRQRSRASGVPGARRDRQPRARSRVSSARRWPPRIRDGDRFSAAAGRLARTLQQKVGIGGYVGGERLSPRSFSRYRCSRCTPRDRRWR